MTNHLTNPRIGQIVTLQSHPIAGDPPFCKVGDKFRVGEVIERPDMDGDLIRVESIDDATGSATTWNVQWFEAEEEPTRPIVDFSRSSRETAREYAAAANSRVLKAESQRLLRDAAAGGQVDAYDLNEAVLDAMRSATTRLDKSMARRDLARKIAYLGHIVQAVLDNHADSLPAYEQGERSRKVKSLEAALREAQAERSSLTQAASDERRRLCAEIDGLRAEVAATASEVKELTQALEQAVEANRQQAQSVSILDAALKEVTSDRDVFASAVDYAAERLTEVDRARLFGYMDGLSTQ